MRFEPFTHSGYQLLHDGTEEMARVEANGIRIDVPRLQKTKQELKDNIREVKSRMEKDDIWKSWKRRFGVNTNLTAKDQLRYIVYDVLKAPKERFTDTGLLSTDDVVLQKIDHPFAKALSRFNKLDKALGTFLKGIEWEIVGDRIHPNFHLDTARTFRSSSSEPNFQNFPARDKEITEMIRSLFIASPGCVLGENDFKGIEVGMSASYHKDQNFIDYISTPGKDMHRDIAGQCFFLEDFLKNWKWGSAKEIRQTAKNGFVFPEFYGAWYKACAKDMWETIAKQKLCAPDGTDLYTHMAKHGVTELGECDPEQDPVEGTFEWHLKEIEKDFWRNRFPGYAQWKRDWFSSYEQNGYFDLYSGFRVHGLYNKKQVCNYPIQGSAFHCLLWCLITINRLLRKYKMKTMIVGQIHDSMLGDTPERELRDYMEIIEHVVKVLLPKHFPWIIVALEIEFEICAPGRPWYKKQEFHFKDGQFKHPHMDKWTRDASMFLAALLETKPPEKAHLPPRRDHQSKMEIPKMLRRERHNRKVYA